MSLNPLANREVTIALLQTASLKGGTGTPVDAAIVDLDRHIRAAAEKGARIICAQEFCLTDYFCRTQNIDSFDLALPVPGPVTNHFSALAKELETVLIIPIFEMRAPGIYHNSALIFDADGILLGTYRKTHIPQDPGFEEKFYFTPGDTGFPVWKTRFGCIGVLICWDQWFPEAARCCALKGAGILFYPTAIGWLPDEKKSIGKAQQHAWKTVQQGHGVANGCYVAAVNRVGHEGETEFWGHSFVSDFYGQTLAQASDSDASILTATCDLNALETFRRTWPFFRDRRPETYQAIGKVFSDDV